MNKLPATFVEADALAYARLHLANMGLAKLCDADGESLGASVVDAEAGRVFVRHLIKQFAMSNPSAMTAVIKNARDGDAESHTALEELIKSVSERDRLPTQLNAYMIETYGSPPPKQSGPHPADKFLQDLAIVAMVKNLLDRFPGSRRQAVSGPRIHPPAVSWQR